MNEADPAGPPPAEPDQPGEPVEPVQPIDQAEQAESAEPAGDRRYPSTIGGAFYLLILASTGVGIGAAYLDDWRLGIRIMGGALIAAAALRLVLRQRDAGMLAVRHRLIDVALLAATGAALVFLAGDIPGPV